MLSIENVGGTIADNHKKKRLKTNFQRLFCKSLESLVGLDILAPAAGRLSIL